MCAGAAATEVEAGSTGSGRWPGFSATSRPMKLGWLALLCCAGACAATAPPLRAVPPGVDRYADAVDWKVAGDEAAALLADYLKVDTFNPPGNELQGARFLEQAL